MHIIKSYNEYHIPPPPIRLPVHIHDLMVSLLHHILPPPSPIRLPVHIHDLMVSLGRAERNFVAQNSRKPSAEELAERLALPLPKASFFLR